HEGLRRRGVLEAPADRAPLPRRARRLGDGAHRRSPQRLRRQGAHRPAALRLGASMSDVILLGAVAYDPKVVSIWEGIREHFREEGAPMDFALFSNYERQVESLLAGHVDVAWNTPLAHVRVKRRTQGRSLSLGMRDSDRDF